ncbi:hypothetical protein DPEC_G00006390 [Dallia pectoralis]|uniref:Uncharacterized protein n=1 Tax=Dallia pectoralis TaxID=75939 RepID=A0ACC2HK45_DALPE|nr:hypothetical protein DPEC_G00006390 [Dallia pectoralis]
MTLSGHSSVQPRRLHATVMFRKRCHGNDDGMAGSCGERAGRRTDEVETSVDVVLIPEARGRGSSGIQSSRDSSNSVMSRRDLDGQASVDYTPRGGMRPAPGH